jgi:hypothetical protein
MINQHGRRGAASRPRARLRGPRSHPRILTANWQQNFSRACDSLRPLDADHAARSKSYESLRIVRAGCDGGSPAWGASGRWIKSSRPDQLKAADSEGFGPESAAFASEHPDPRPSGAPLVDAMNSAKYRARSAALFAFFAFACGSPTHPRHLPCRRGLAVRRLGSSMPNRHEDGGS